MDSDSKTSDEFSNSQTAPSHANHTVRLEDIIKKEGIYSFEKEDESSRYCYKCGNVIKKGNGYLLQGSIPAYMKNFGSVVGFTSLTGTSCEHRSGEHSLTLWYWYCDTCILSMVPRENLKYLDNGALTFWTTGQPPERPPKYSTK